MLFINYKYAEPHFIIRILNRKISRKPQIKKIIFNHIFSIRLLYLSPYYREKRKISMVIYQRKFKTVDRIKTSTEVSIFLDIFKLSHKINLFHKSIILALKVYRIFFTPLLYLILILN